jgi:galactokinase
MMGGGFGGCTINIIKTSSIEEITKKITTSYAQVMHKVLAIYITSIEEGTHIE